MLDLRLFARTLIRQRLKESGPLLLPAVRPLAVPTDDEEGLVPAGTCVLIRYRGASYVITAAHVIDLYPERAYYVGTTTTWVEIERPFRTTVAPPAGRSADIYDFAFKRLTDSEADRLDGCRFLGESEIACGDEIVYTPPHRSKYVALGYPLNKFCMDRVERKTNAENLAYSGTAAPREMYAKLGLSSATHIVVEYDRKKVVGEHGVQVSPKVTGLSGGGLFRHRGLERAADASLPQLLGILLEKRDMEKVMFAVRVDIVLNAIDATEGPSSAG